MTILAWIGIALLTLLATGVVLAVLAAGCFLGWLAWGEAKPRVRRRLEEWRVSRAHGRAVEAFVREERRSHAER